MKVIKNGEKIEMTYEAICEDLGDYIPSIHFIKVTTQGRISFTAGKPDEVTTLIANVTSKGYMPSNKLKEVIRMEKKSYVEQLSEQYGWPLKIKARGYIAHLCDIQPLNADEKPIPVYRFPGGRSIVSECEMVPADMEKPQLAGRS